MAGLSRRRCADVHGSFAQSAAGTTQFDVMSDASGVPDVLIIDGNASLGGSAAIEFFGVDAPALEIPGCCLRLVAG